MFGPEVRKDSQQPPENSEDMFSTYSKKDFDIHRGLIEPEFFTLEQLTTGVSLMFEELVRNKPGLKDKLLDGLIKVGKEAKGQDEKTVMVRKYRWLSKFF